LLDQIGTRHPQADGEPIAVHSQSI
jgi:hypothetical protein